LILLIAYLTIDVSLLFIVQSIISGELNNKVCESTYRLFNYSDNLSLGANFGKLSSNINIQYIIYPENNSISILILCSSSFRLVIRIALVYIFKKSLICCSFNCL
jgi:hypothetical protein